MRELLFSLIDESRFDARTLRRRMVTSGISEVRGSLLSRPEKVSAQAVVFDGARFDEVRAKRWLSDRGVRFTCCTIQAYSPDQERDEHGRFGAGAGSGSGSGRSSLPSSEAEFDTGRQFSAKDVAAVESYALEGNYADINDNLRAGIETPDSKALDAAFKNAPTLSEDVTLYRDASGLDIKYKHDLREDAFMSTTTDRATAERYATRDGMTPTADVWSIKVPKGTSFIKIGKVFNEILLPRGLTLYVDNIGSNKTGLRQVWASVK